ncbi:hypothetical protein [Mycobacterium sp. UM_CSW]|uniref:hypothetical protein n=1 Tax=Mycobacterium sp. UM_CSW TaxID=1370119 RepID=UPI000428EE4A|nr:hypothetical protein [Mycobacterium sp. UM_CSW]
MADNDLTTQFEKLSAAVKEANEKVRAAGQQAREQVQADAARARDRASKAADHLQDRADAAHDEASKHWQELAGNWKHHVDKIRNDMAEKRAAHEAKEMDVYANMAISYALDAIDFAESAVYEAEYAVLDALSARSAADAMAT